MEQVCRPQISEKIKDDYRQIECEISTCKNVSKILYEKTNVHTSTIWMQVFEGINKTNYHHIDTTYTDYSLENRNDYTAFQTKHLLLIKPLVKEDQGKWRCVVYDQNNMPWLSRFMDLYFVENHNNDSPCLPVITGTGSSDVDIGDALNLHCEISKCKEVSRLLYERTDMDVNWIAVYDSLRVNQSKLLTDTYTQFKRYSVVDDDNTLIIKPTTLEDKGKWRCVVVDYTNETHASQQLNVDIYVTPDVEIPSITPIPDELTKDQTTAFTCIVDGIHPEPNVVWKVDGVEHTGGIPSNKLSEDGLWFVMNTIRLRFEQVGVTVLSCVMKTDIRDPWLQTHIGIDIIEQQTSEVSWLTTVGITGLVVVALASVVGVSVCFNKWRKQETKANADCEDADGSCSKPELITMSDYGNADLSEGYAEINEIGLDTTCGTEIDKIDSTYLHMESLNSQPDLTENTMNEIVYKRMDSHGHATYVTKDEMDRSDYTCMDSPTYSNKDIMLFEIANHGPHTYMNNEAIEAMTKKKHHDVLIDKPK